MPIYEYRCLDCGKRSALLVLNIAAPPPPACQHCRSARVERLLSRFAAPKSEEARLEALTDPSALGDLDEHDPASMERFVKKMGREMGEDLGEDFEAELDSAMEGEAGGAAESDSTGMD